jgi:hypothetical protein
MATDVFVMPIWRFKVGDFDSPLERLAPAEKIHYATPGGIVSKLDLRGRLSRWRARREVRAVARAVSAANGVAVSWVDEGPCVYDAQFRGEHPLKSYIWWLERRDLLGEFHLPEDGSEAAGRVWQTGQDRPVSHPHLWENGFYNDYFLPAEFERVVEVEPYLVFGRSEAARSVSSTPQALRELEALNRHLRADPDYEWRDDDPLAAVKLAFNHVWQILDLSHRHGLPVIFWG